MDSENPPGQEVGTIIIYFTDEEAVRFKANTVSTDLGVKLKQGLAHVRC